MKSLQSIIITLLLVVAAGQMTYAGGNEKAVITTSAVCGMCEARIESAVMNLDGVKKASLNVATKELKVKYNSEIVDIDDIRASISNAGYDADDVKAEKSAYNNLPGCCKKSCSATKSSCGHK